MQECEAAIGMRYHFAIAALLTQTPCLSIGYSPKVTSLMASHPDRLISVEKLSAEALEKSLETILKKDPHSEEQIKKETMELRSRAEDNIRLAEEFFKTV